MRYPQALYRALVSGGIPLAHFDTGSLFPRDVAAAARVVFGRTVPLGLGITKTTVFNRRPMNLGVQYYYNVERPDGGAGQQLRFVIALLYPK